MGKGGENLIIPKRGGGGGGGRCTIFSWRTAPPAQRKQAVQHRGVGARAFSAPTPPPAEQAGIDLSTMLQRGRRLEPEALKFRV